MAFGLGKGWGGEAVKTEEAIATAAVVSEGVNILTGGSNNTFGPGAGWGGEAVKTGEIAATAAVAVEGASILAGGGNNTFAPVNSLGNILSKADAEIGSAVIVGSGIKNNFAANIGGDAKTKRKEKKLSSPLNNYEELAAFLLKAESMHSKVPYGNGQSVFDQVCRGAEIALNSTGSVELAKLALLCKSQKPQKIETGQTMAYEDIEKIGGKDLAAMVKLLASEPNAPEKNETLWQKKTEWARTLPPMAKQMLLIEKAVNFETSRDHPNPAWSTEEHKNYILTRMLVVDACKDASPALHALASKAAQETMEAQQTKEAEKREQETGKSWGEKYKGKTYHILRNWVLNYFINFAIGASVTYAFDTSKLGEKFCGFRDRQAERFKDTIAPGATKFVTNFFVRAQTILCGGHVVLPVLKWMKDNRRRLEFKIGHKLDLMQEFLGKGNAASKRSLEEYNHVSSLVSIGDHNRNQSDTVKTSDLSAEDKRLLRKNSIDQNLQFEEKKQSWMTTIKARLTGILFTTSTSIALGLASSSKFKALKFEKYYEEPAGKWVGDKIISRIPIISRIFKKANALPHVPGNTLTGHQLIGKYFIDDMIFTAASKAGFDLIERKHDKKMREKEMAEEAKDEPEEIVRREILIKEGPKSFRERATEVKDAQPYVIPFA